MKSEYAMRLRKNKDQKSGKRINEQKRSKNKNQNLEALKIKNNSMIGGIRL